MSLATNRSKSARVMKISAPQHPDCGARLYPGHTLKRYIRKCAVTIVVVRVHTLAGSGMCWVADIRFTILCQCREDGHLYPLSTQRICRHIDLAIHHPVIIEPNSSRGESVEPLLRPSPVTSSNVPSPRFRNDPCHNSRRKDRDGHHSCSLLQPLRFRNLSLRPRMHSLLGVNLPFTIVYIQSVA